MMHRERGFTLIELMIVIAIIGILAIIAIPRFVDLVDKAKEGATKGSIGAMRGAMVVYYGDNEGFFPYDINDWWGGFQLGTTTLPPFSQYVEGGVLPRCQLRRAHSNNNCNYAYVVADLSGGKTKITPTGSAAGPAVGVMEGGWLYCNDTSPGVANYGHIWVNSGVTDTKGAYYSSY